MTFLSHPLSAGWLLVCTTLANYCWYGVNMICLGVAFLALFFVILWASWMCGLVFDINLEESQSFYLNYFFWSFLFFSSRISVTGCYSSHSCPTFLSIVFCLFFFQSFPPLFSSLKVFIWHIFKLTESFLNQIHSVNKISCHSSFCFSIYLSR
jgi:hypothetical protein